ELARGRLERAAVVEVAPNRLEQLARLSGERLVDLLDQAAPGESVARERAFRQQVIGRDGAGGSPPRAGHGDAREGGARAARRLDEVVDGGAENERARGEVIGESLRDLEE